MNSHGSWENESLVSRCAVSRDRAAAAFLEWLAAYKYTPVDLLQRSLMDDARQVYLPYYKFDVRYSADYSVSIGYHRLEEYTAYETVYEDGKSRQVPRTKTRLVTDWRPYSNAAKGSFAEVIPDQALGGGDFSAFLRETTFATGELVPSSSVDDGGQVLPFARTPQESYARFVEGTVGERISSKIRGSLPGDTHRDLRYEWSGGYDWSRVYLPFWHFKWEYGGEAYGAVVDGRQATRVDGRLPKDNELQRSANATLRPLWIALGVGLLACVSVASVGALSGVAGWFYAAAAVVVLTAGVVSLRRRHQILSEAKGRRNEAVARVLSAELEEPQNLEQHDDREERESGETEVDRGPHREKYDATHDGTGRTRADGDKRTEATPHESERESLDARSDAPGA